MNKALLTLAACALLGLTAAAQAADATAGQTKAAACGGCHGPDGNSMTPMNPSLAGQKEEYLVVAMMAYKNGGRNHPTMTAMLAASSEADVRDMAAFYASQKCK